MEPSIVPWKRPPIDAVTGIQALDLQDETRYSFYDSLVLAAALQAGADEVYTEDLQHNQLVRGTLRIVNPFLLVANNEASVLTGSV